MSNPKNIDELYRLIAKQQFDNITDEDWEMLLAMLSEKRDWEQMWRLAQITPVMWSVRLLLRLKEAAWIPEQDVEREAFIQLAQLTDKCNKKTINILGGRLVHPHKTLAGHTDEIICITINSDGRLLASGSRRTLLLWSLPKGILLHTLEGSDNFELTFGPGAQLLVSEGMTWRRHRIGEYFEYYEFRCWHVGSGKLEYIGEKNLLTCLVQIGKYWLAEVGMAIRYNYRIYRME